MCTHSLSAFTVTALSGVGYLMLDMHKLDKGMTNREQHSTKRTCVVPSSELASHTGSGAQAVSSEYYGVMGCVPCI